MINPILKPNIGGGLPMIVLCEHVAGGTIWVSLDGGTTWIERSSTFGAHTPYGIAIGGDIRNIVCTGNSSNTSDAFTAYAAEDGAFASYSGGTDSYAAPAHASLDGTRLYSLRTHTTEIISYSLNGGASWAIRTGYGDQPTQLCSTRDNLTVWVAHLYTTHKYLRKFTNGINNTSSVLVTPFGAGRHTSVACSGDGKYVYAGEGYITSMKVAVSGDYGSNWSIKTLATGLTSSGYNSRLMCNESGQYVMSIGHGSTIRTIKLSNDYGQTWSSIVINGYSPYYLQAQVMSKSGKYMILGDVVSNQIFHVSSDYGVTWSTLSAPTGFAAVRVINASIQDPISGSSGVIQTSISTITSVITSQLTNTSWNTAVGSAVVTQTIWATNILTTWNTSRTTTKTTSTSYNTVGLTELMTELLTWTLTNPASAMWITVEFPTHWNTLKDTILGVTNKDTITSWNTTIVTSKTTTKFTMRDTATGGGSEVATSRDTTTSWNTDKSTTTSWNTSE